MTRQTIIVKPTILQQKFQKNQMKKKIASKEKTYKLVGEKTWYQQYNALFTEAS